eukprot:TRINITY_DN120791_c0_g1_i1.p1 TRINITY_DN120791_c0_g1~~TRINITY_DN120791_c0_g1_i1.p1  ORF type:complete len:672 (-),score=115.53 TRINITY_DN120791_c0_g1_i1:805-2820(-)
MSYDLTHGRVAQLLPGWFGDVSLPREGVFKPLAFFSEEAARKHAPFARPLDLPTFNALTLQYVRYAQQKEDEWEDCGRRIAKLSKDGELQVRGAVHPGHGYAVRGGMWIDKGLDDFLQDCLIVFIAGFNDKKWKDHAKEVGVKVDEHINYYRWYCEQRNCQLAFVEVDDQHGNAVPWLSALLREKLAREKDMFFVPSVPHDHVADDSAFGALPLPPFRWPAGPASEDNIHFGKEQLDAWFPEVLYPWLKRFALEVSCRNALLVTDSTALAHDYKPVVRESRGRLNLVLRTYEGESYAISVSPRDTVSKLKCDIVERHFPRKDACFSDVQLYSGGRKLRPYNSSLSELQIQDGAELMLTWKDKTKTTEPEPGGVDEKLPPEAIRVDTSFIAEETRWKQHGGDTFIPLRTEALRPHRRSVSAYCCAGEKMARDCYDIARREGIFLLKDSESAFRFARSVELSSSDVSRSRWWAMIVECQVDVDATADAEIDGGPDIGTIYCVPHGSNVIVPCALVVREVPAQRAGPGSAEDCNKHASAGAPDCWAAAQARWTSAAASSSSSSFSYHGFKGKRTAEANLPFGKGGAQGGKGMRPGGHLLEAASRELIYYLRHEQRNAWTSVAEVLRAVRSIHDENMLYDVVDTSLRDGVPRFQVDPALGVRARSGKGSQKGKRK